jgi:hypothetical protein
VKFANLPINLQVLISAWNRQQLAVGMEINVNLTPVGYLR